MCRAYGGKSYASLQPLRKIDHQLVELLRHFFVRNVIRIRHAAQRLRGRGLRAILPAC